jgi:outer membrane protein TolC
MACLILVLGGCSAAHYKRSADQEAYALIAQKTPLVSDMPSRFTIDRTNVLSFDGYPVSTQTNAFLGPAAAAEIGAHVLTLKDALGLAVSFNRTYQDNKDTLYQSALTLSLARHRFAPLFSSGLDASYNVDSQQVQGFEPDPVTGEPKPILSDQIIRKARASGNVGVDWLIRDIGRITAAFTADFTRFFGNPSSLANSAVVGTFSRPLLRNAGFKTEQETLIQAERDLLYSVRTFVRFRKTFSTQIASAYYTVLENRDAARNAYFNLESSRRAEERTQALAAEGRQTQTDLGRTKQQVLSAESAWIASVRTYQRGLDGLKILLGLPVVTRIILDDHELQQLRIEQPTINTEDAIQIALAARLDYLNALDGIDDAKRKVAIAADLLKAQLDLTARAAMTSPDVNHGFPVPDPSRYSWNAGVNLDLPLERKAERNAYASSLIHEAQVERNTQQLRDEIELEVRESWRTLEEAKRSYEIAEIGVELAKRRVEEQDLLAELGKGRALDQIDAQNSLLLSQDQRTRAIVNHTVARIQFWANMGILYIKDDGQWQEGPSTLQGTATADSK